jgi:hypothetical protein
MDAQVVTFRRACRRWYKKKGRIPKTVMVKDMRLCCVSVSMLTTTIK